MCRSMLKDLLAAAPDIIAIQPHFVVLMSRPLKYHAIKFSFSFEGKESNAIISVFNIQPNENGNQQHFDCIQTHSKRSLIKPIFYR